MKCDDQLLERETCRVVQRLADQAQVTRGSRWILAQRGTALFCTCGSRRGYCGVNDLRERRNARTCEKARKSDQDMGPHGNSFSWKGPGADRNDLDVRTFDISGEIRRLTMPRAASVKVVRLPVAVASLCGSLFHCSHMPSSSCAEVASKNARRQRILGVRLG